MSGDLIGIVVWPSVAVQLYEGQQFKTLGLGLGVGALAAWYFFGVPSTDLPLMTLAEQYLLVGAGLVGAQKVLGT